MSTSVKVNARSRKDVHVNPAHLRAVRCRHNKTSDLLSRLNEPHIKIRPPRHTSGSAVDCDVLSVSTIDHILYAKRRQIAGSRSTRVALTPVTNPARVRPTTSGGLTTSTIECQLEEFWCYELQAASSTTVALDRFAIARPPLHACLRPYCGNARRSRRAFAN